ncbi:spermidine synthase isoform X2 [Anastrepha obliqua]|uniref:spermidine synthase isoform X1 n=1 Tax=Anastrepha obliqua TaxID=95512 RepID=UPI002409E9E3|nr:spermidine synthase isoform X1 [Anastrepha obliqua]XP_054725398.1 spermidine synthase isoform X2 [Anastrepha obliqua]
MMEAIANGWFSELQNDLWPGQAFSLKINKIIHEEKSKYQDIKVIETSTYGTCLVLDGIIQCTTRDEFSYQEMISFLPLNSHPNPRKVLIVGGGDGGVAREVAKHPLVEEIHQVEIDERVVELSKKYLPNMACGFQSPKLKLTIGDGFAFMKTHENEFDVIITDSSDPVGPAVSLFQENYYQLMKKSLRPGGIVCSQGGTYWLDCEHVKNTVNSCKKHFPTVAYAHTTVPSYPCGHIGFVIGCADSNRDLKTPIKKFSKTELDDMKLKYYSSDIHSAAFALPRWVEKSFLSI